MLFVLFMLFILFIFLILFMLVKLPLLTSFTILLNSQESTCDRVPVLIKLLAEKETLALVPSCELCEISKNTFSYKTPPETASVNKVFYTVVQVEGTLNLILDIFSLLTYLWLLLL